MDGNGGLEQKMKANMVFGMWGRRFTVEGSGRRILEE